MLQDAASLYRKRRGSLVDCIKTAAKDFLDAEFALRVLRGVLWLQDITDWEAHPMRRRSDVWRALKTAIRWCSRRVGGWRVGGRDRAPASSVPANRQWLEWLPASR